MTVKADGLFLDAELVKAYYRGCYYSAPKETALHFLDSLSSLEAARKFDRDLGAAPPGSAAEFKNWFAHLLDTKAGRANPVDYFIGFKAEQEGRISDAADWYWLSHTIGQNGDGEAHWSRQQLATWNSASKSLARLANRPPTTIARK